MKKQILAGVSIVLVSAATTSAQYGTQSLIEAAEAAKKIPHEWPLSTNVGSGTGTGASPAVETKKDELKKEPTSAAKNSTSVAKDEPKSDDGIRLKALSNLKAAQKALREGEDAERDLKHAFENRCGPWALEPDGLVRLEEIRPCATMRFAISDSARTLDRLRDSIRAIAVLAGVNPGEAVRSFAQ